MSQKILVTGGDGLLAQALRQAKPAGGDLVFLPRQDFDPATPVTRR